MLSGTAGTISGSVEDKNGDLFPYATVTLIPQDQQERPVKALPDDNGSFRFAHLAPGKYTLFAWEEIDDGLWPDPEFRRRYADRATSITVGPSETQDARLRVITVDEME